LGYEEELKVKQPNVFVWKLKKFEITENDYQDILSFRKKQNKWYETYGLILHEKNKY
jgi:hypothetical protein